MKRRALLLAMLAVIVQAVSTRAPGQAPGGNARKVVKTDQEWQKLLTTNQYLVTRKKMTEPAFSGKYANSHVKGVYACVCCGAGLFSSRAKFNSGTGWPSFYQPLSAKSVDAAPDYSEGEPRVEVLCMDCGAHLGHVFPDGPPPTGQRFCINSLSLKLIPEPAAKTAKKSEKAEPKADAAEPTDSKPENPRTPESSPEKGANP